MDQVKIGNYIADIRKEKKMTQKELAEAIGVNHKAITKWECGNLFPDISVLPFLENALHCDIDSLLGYAAEQQKITDYEECYKADGYFWGFRLQICAMRL